MSAPLRIVAFGSESTGKTTLAEALAKRLGCPWSAEYVRAWVDAMGRDPGAVDVDAIARGQLAAEDAAIAIAVDSGSPVVLHDTDLLSTLVYAEHYYGADAIPAWIHETIDRRRPALYLLCDIDVPWAPDPQRNRGDRRAELQALFRNALEMREWPYVVVTGLDTVREEHAMSAITSLLDSAAR